MADASTITRQALGRSARLGDLYDAATDTFCAISLLNKLPPPSAVRQWDNHRSNISLTTGSSLDEKLSTLAVKADLKMSVLAGMVELGGSGKYLDEKKHSYKSVESSLMYNVSTVVQQLDLLSDSLQDCICTEAAKHPGATHVVTKIYWGANCVVTMTSQKSDDEKKKEVEAAVTARLEKLKTAASGGGKLEVASTSDEKQNRGRFSLKIFGDVLPDDDDEFPTDEDGVVALMKKMPKLVRKSNGGRGKPLTYVMFPLSSPALRKCLEDADTMANFYRNTDEVHIVQVVNLFSFLTKLKQKVHDYVELLNDHSRCITTPEEIEDVRSCERDLGVQEARLKSDLKNQLRIARRTAEEGALDELYKEHHKTADETYKKGRTIYKKEKKQMVFATRCKKFGVKYLTAEEKIVSACDRYENVYVLFDGRPAADLRAKTRSTFIEIARNNQDSSTTVCYVIWPENLEESGGVRIERYSRGERVQADVVGDLENKDIAQCVSATRRAYCLVPFTVRCPRSSDDQCSKDERPLTCDKCRETLQFSVADGALYCACGHAGENQFRFRCRSGVHGWTSIQCSDALQTLGDYHASHDTCGGDY